MVYNSECQQLNLCMLALREYFYTPQHFKCPSLCLDNLWKFIQRKRTGLAVLLLQAVHTVHSVVLLKTLPQHLELSNYSYQNDYILLSQHEHLPSHPCENLESHDLEELYII